MYAVFEDGSRQYRVSEGDRVQLDLRKDDAGVPLPVGATFAIDRVLLFADGTDVQIGKPAIAGMRVIAEVIQHTSVKTVIQKFRRRKNYRRRTGHRQPFLKVRIANILMPGQDTPVKKNDDALVSNPPAEATQVTTPTA